MTGTQALEQRLRALLPQEDIFPHEPLCDHTTFRIGGPCDWLVTPKDGETLCRLWTMLQETETPYVILGGGSNLLCDDAGFRGVAIQTSRMDGLTRQGDTISAGCGVRLSRLAVFAAREGLGDLTFAHGIPGTVGGGVVMNAGAYGGELKEAVATVEYCREGRLYTVTGKECEFGHRTSVFQADPARIIVCATFALLPMEERVLQDRMQELAAKRRASQPLGMPSAGSVFKRPAPNCYVGAMVEECGLKGYRIGGAVVSEKHAGFIVNTGGATCADVRNLIDHVRKQVKARFDKEIHSEIRYLSPQGIWEEA